MPGIGDAFASQTNAEGVPGRTSAFDGPAPSGHAHEGFQHGLGRGCIEAIVGMLGLLFDAAPHQQPVASAIFFPALDQSPVVQPFPLLPDPAKIRSKNSFGRLCAIVRTRTWDSETLLATSTFQET